MKPLPDKQRLRIMWQVAVSSAIEGQGESYEIFANLLHNYFTGKFDHITLADEWLGKGNVKLSEDNYD